MCSDNKVWTQSTVDMAQDKLDKAAAVAPVGTHRGIYAGRFNNPVANS